MDLEMLNEISVAQLSGRKAIRVLTCQSSGCMSARAKEVKAALIEACKSSDIAAEVEVVQVGRMGICGEGPLVRVEPNNIAFKHVTAENAAGIIHQLASLPNETPELDLHQPFFAKQHRIVLENSGHIDPEKIDDYIAQGGYKSLFHAVHDQTPAEVIETITKGGLQGRGGAGYPTGLKWGMVAKSKGEKKYVICNADEGDPGAFMDRCVLETDPHRVLEGMAIAAYAVGAEQGYVYTRGEYPLAISRMQTAIKQARFNGLLGTQIFDSNFNFRIDIRIGGGVFVCGEETALIQSVEGKRGIRRCRAFGACRR